MSQFDNLLADKEPQAYALVRIVTGFLFIFHGSQKLLNFPKEFTYDLSPLMIAAGGIELVGGILVMIGLFTRPAAFICSGTMAVAYWMAHGMRDVFPMLKRWRVGGDVLLCLFVHCRQRSRDLELG